MTYFKASTITIHLAAWLLFLALPFCLCGGKVMKLAGTFHDALLAREFLKTTQVDLVFIDIQMPDISGLDLVRMLPEKPIIIFTTAHKKFAYEGFELEALDYLLKPLILHNLPGLCKKR